MVALISDDEWWLLFQSKLNCEVLLEELAFEVRWAVAEDSVVIQLVAKLGEAQAATSAVELYPLQGIHTHPEACAIH